MRMAEAIGKEIIHLFQGVKFETVREFPDFDSLLDLSNIL